MEYELLLTQSESYSTNQHEKSPEQSTRIKALVNFSRMIGNRDTPLFQLLLFSKVKNYIRFIVLRKVYEAFPDVKKMRREGRHETIFQSFMELGNQLELFTYQHDTYSLKEEYWITEEDRRNLLNFQSGFDNENVNLLTADYQFIENTITAVHDSRLGKMMQKKEYVYIKEVLTYLIEINKLDFYGQISPSFSEDFYTDLGELAFDIYTKDNYLSFIKKKQFRSILDIGCGNGNYIDVLLEQKIPKIVGVERQEKVYKRLVDKYRNQPNVVIYNEDINNLELDEKYEMINMSYMLFYLNETEKINLFQRLKQLLSDDGLIVICQYYPDFELYQELIAKHNNRWDFISRFKYDICNSILRAEVVLNNMLVDFEQAEEWEPFLQLLETCGFQVSEITPADDTYYSYFISIQHKKGD